MTRRSFSLCVSLWTNCCSSSELLMVLAVIVVVSVCDGVQGDVFGAELGCGVQMPRTKG
jgi:hypothetical protein